MFVIFKDMYRLIDLDSRKHEHTLFSSMVLNLYSVTNIACF